MKKMNNNQLCNDDWGWFIDLEDMKCKRTSAPTEMIKNMDTIDEEYEYYMNVQNCKKEAELEEKYSKNLVIYEYLKKIATSIAASLVVYTILSLC